MNTTAESSFAPLEYYKKLTSCLANRKNLKLKLSKIPGAKQTKNTPFITNRKIQQKFLAKYNLRRQTVLATANPQLNKQNEPLFNINKNFEKAKRKNEDESYINLPDSFFKSRPMNKLPIFKVPEVPPVKKQKPAEGNTITSNNFTIASLFSGNFNPPKCSTPLGQKSLQQSNLSIDQPHPIIADPNEILKDFPKPEEVQKVERHSEVVKAANKPEERLKELKKYVNSIDESAKYLDAVCFAKSFDPADSIVKNLNRKYEDATQSPRRSLISSAKRTESDFETPKEQQKIKSWPIPVFYEQSPKEKEEFKFDDGDSLFEHTKNLFSFLDEEDDPFDFDLNGSPSIDFEYSPRKSSDNFSCFDTPSTLSVPLKNYMPTCKLFSPFNIHDNKFNEKDDDMNWLESSFTSMNWDTESNCSQTTAKLHSELEALFRSPPKSNQLKLENHFSRTISRPKNFFKENSFEDIRSKEEDLSWWSKGLNESFTFSPASNIFDSKFNFF